MSSVSRFALLVESVVRKNGLFSSDNHVLACVSGGPDSVGLLSVLKELATHSKMKVSAVHINHGLRGAESDSDALFVEDMCTRMNIPFVCEQVSLNFRKTGSVQAEARTLRYAAIRQVALRIGADKIALAHTADDQAETVLLWMMRGAGAAGLAGIPVIRDGMWIRPFLSVQKKDILTYLQQKGLEFRTDSSNAKLIYLRNRVRLHLLPVLERINPAIVRVLGRQAMIVSEENRYLDQLATDQMSSLCIRDQDGEVLLDREKFLQIPLAMQRRIVRMIIRKVTGTTQGPTFATVDLVLARMLHAQCGSVFNAAGVMASRQHYALRFSANGQVGRTLDDDGRSGEITELPCDAPVQLTGPLAGQVMRLSLIEGSDGPAFPRETLTGSCRCVVLDADTFSLPVWIRSWQPGDWFQPVGMEGKRKKLQDFFSDRKVPRDARSHVPCLVAPEGILWVAAYRADHRFRATTVTKRRLHVELLDGGEKQGEKK
jgi:tRNA(Ile)-lysidine synthase